MYKRTKVYFYIALALLLGGLVACSFALAFGRIAGIIGLALVAVALVFVIMLFVSAIKGSDSTYKPEDNPPKAH